jgi:eukaryotic-like serine/threonine-protein kinase
VFSDRVLHFPSVQPGLPKRIGRYEVLGQLAAGGMAEILLARLSGRAGFERAVVIKRILRTLASREAFVKMFLDEARIVASLRHANVVDVQELGEHEGEVFLVMEYVPGENVSSLLKRTVAAGELLDPRLAAHVIAEACAGLHAAHELTDDGRPQNLVHRDVSPQNLLVGYDGHVKLVDFGVALVDEKTTRTEPGEVKGKFDYMSPEQMLGKPLDRRSDLFSAGVVLYELSTGRRLFKRKSHAKTIEAITREPIVPPSRVRPDYPPALEAIVLRALSKSPEDRYASAADMRSDLVAIARELANPVDALAEGMRKLFPDRIAEKEEMLRKVGAGDELSHVPAGETDETIEVPSAPEQTVVDPLIRPQPEPIRILVPVPTPGPMVPMPAPKANNVPAMIAIGAALMVALGAIATTVIVVKRSGAATPPPSAAAITSDAKPGDSASSASEIVVHVETKPAGARVLVGGREHGESPLDVRVARGAQPVPIEIRRPGYLTAAQQVVPDADQKVLVVLTPVPVRGRPAARPGAKPAATPSHAVDPAPPPTPATPAPTTSSGFRRFD